MQSEPTGIRASPQESAHKALASDVKARSPKEAAELLAEHPGPVIAAVLLEINPGTALDILGELHGGLADAVMHAVSPEIALQWQRNQTDIPGANSGIPGSARMVRAAGLWTRSLTGTLSGSTIVLPAAVPPLSA